MLQRMRTEGRTPWKTAVLLHAGSPCTPRLPQPKLLEVRHIPQHNLLRIGHVCSERHQTWRMLLRETHTDILLCPEPSYTRCGGPPPPPRYKCDNATWTCSVDSHGAFNTSAKCGAGCTKPPPPPPPPPSKPLANGLLPMSCSGAPSGVLTTIVLTFACPVVLFSHAIVTPRK